MRTGQLKKKRNFIKKLDERAQKIPKYKQLLVIGDFNVRWHFRREHEESILGPYTVGRGSEYLEKVETKLSQATNREQCMDWCEGNEMMHLSSWINKNIVQLIICNEIMENCGNHLMYFIFR